MANNPDPFIELRYDEDDETVAVIDGVVQATPGASRASVMRAITREWADRKRHEATLIVRVSGCGDNGTAAERGRRGGGR